MTARTVQWLITISAVTLVLIHLIWPNLAIDAITLSLLIVAIVPWLAPLFKSIQFPGGWKVTFRDLQQAKERADRAGLLAAPPASTTRMMYSFQLLADEDPNLILAGLRIEIAKRLVQIAESHDIAVQGRSAGNVLRLLAERQLLTLEERAVLADMLGLLNAAVHGVVVDRRAADWAMDVGPRLLQTLDERIVN